MKNTMNVAVNNGKHNIELVEDGSNSILKFSEGWPETIDSKEIVRALSTFGLLKEIGKGDIVEQIRYSNPHESMLKLWGANDIRQFTGSDLAEFVNTIRKFKNPTQRFMLFVQNERFSCATLSLIATICGFNSKQVVAGRIEKLKQTHPAVHDRVTSYAYRYYIRKGVMFAIKTKNIGV